MPRNEASDRTLAVSPTGPTGSPPVVFLHGFTQTGRCGGPAVADLARDHRVLLVDLPGHGGSARHAGSDLPGAADLLAATVGPEGPALVLGYSMGARVGLHLALARPDLVAAMVLVGGTAGIDDAGERAARRAADGALADRLEAIGVAAFVDEWLALPLFAGLAPWARFDEERRANTAAGLAGSLRHAGTGTMEPLWDRLGAVEVPVRCVAGERDDKFRQLADRLARSIGPGATSVVVPGAGHAAHLEAPDAVTAVVRGLTGRAQPPT